MLKHDLEHENEKAHSLHSLAIALSLSPSLNSISGRNGKSRTKTKNSVAGRCDFIVTVFDLLLVVLAFSQNLCHRKANESMPKCM